MGYFDCPDFLYLLMDTFSVSVIFFSLTFPTLPLQYPVSEEVWTSINPDNLDEAQRVKVKILNTT